MCAQMTWNARSVPSGGCNGGAAAWRGMHWACLFRQGHEQARRGCIDATATLGAEHVGGEGERGKGSCAGGEVQARGEGGKDACAQDDAPFRQTDGKREVRGGLWEGWDIPHRST